MTQTTPWVKIKAEYLQGATPQSLAKKYKLTAKQISDKAYQGNWASEKSRISEKTRENIQSKIETLSNNALEVLSEVMNDPEAKNMDKVSAARAILDVSGLKSVKQELTGNLDVQKIFITEKEHNETKKHIQDVINEQ